MPRNTTPSCGATTDGSSNAPAIGPGRCDSCSPRGGSRWRSTWRRSSASARSNCSPRGSPPQSAKTALLILLVTSTALHFYYDGFIWKVRERGTQQNLGIEAAGRRAAVVPGLIHATKWLGLAGVAALLFWIESSGAPRTIDNQQAWIATLARWTPDVPELAVRQCRLAMARHQPDEAVNAARRAVSLSPRSADAQAALGDSLLAAGRDEPAAAALHSAVALAPDVWENHFHLAEAAGRIGDWDEADREYAISARGQPKNPIVEQDWGEMCQRRGAVAAALSRTIGPP